MSCSSSFCRTVPCRSLRDLRQTRGSVSSFCVSFSILKDNGMTTRPNPSVSMDIFCISWWNPRGSHHVHLGRLNPIERTSNRRLWFEVLTGFLSCTMTPTTIHSLLYINRIDSVNDDKQCMFQQGLHHCSIHPHFFFMTDSCATHLFGIAAIFYRWPQAATAG